MVTNTLLRLLMRASLRRKAGRPRKYATVCAQLRSPNTDRLCTRAKELAKKHVVGGDLSADARSLLIYTYRLYGITGLKRSSWA
jgi:hypothetical protein